MEDFIKSISETDNEFKSLMKFGQIIEYCLGNLKPTTDYSKQIQDLITENKEIKVQMTKVEADSLIAIQNTEIIKKLALPEIATFHAANKIELAVEVPEPVVTIPVLYEKTPVECFIKWAKMPDLLIGPTGKKIQFRKYFTGFYTRYKIDKSLAENADEVATNVFFTELYNDINDPVNEQLPGIDMYKKIFNICWTTLNK